MQMNLDWLFQNLEKSIKEDYDSFHESIIYLDIEQLENLYSGFTGLKGRPTVEVQSVGGALKTNILLAGADLTGGISQTYGISDSHILKSILPKLKETYKEIDKLTPDHLRQRVWLKGEFSNTHYLGGVRTEFHPIYKPELILAKDKVCELLFIENFLSSLYRPVFEGNKGIKEPVELLGHIHVVNDGDISKSKVQAIISPIVILRR